ncbi:MAG: hypothetical protein ACI8W7_002205, partial [Gammaproteobacteria bacterium]
MVHIRYIAPRFSDSHTHKDRWDIAPRCGGRVRRQRHDSSNSRIVGYEYSLPAGDLVPLVFGNLAAQHFPQFGNFHAQCAELLVQIGFDVLTRRGQRLIVFAIFLLGKGLHRVDDDRDKQVEHGKRRDQNEDHE